MKSLRLFFCILTALVMTLSFSSCKKTPTPEPNPEVPSVPDQPEDPGYHFDIWIALDKHGGMGRDVQTLVRSMDSLTAGQEIIDFVGEGTEVHSKLSLESIVKGPYYYQVPVSEDRFGKYTLSDNKINIVQEQPFGSNTYSPRKYTHAWTNDNTLVVMAANGAASQIIWTKLSANLTILDEGILDLPVPEGSAVFTTSGILTYREQDNKLIYFYYGKEKKGLNSTASKVYTCVINPSTMEIEHNTQSSFLDETAGSAYGELLQQSTFFDESGNLYVAALQFDENDKDVEHPRLVRVKAGEYDIDPDYNAFTEEGKLLTVQYLGNGKVLGYARNDELGTKIESYSHYYCIIDLNAKTVSRIRYKGENLPYSGGRFSQRSAVVDGKAYIGINPESTNPCIYIYDIATGNVEKGVEIAEGYYFEQIRVIENLSE